MNTEIVIQSLQDQILEAPYLYGFPNMEDGEPATPSPRSSETNSPPRTIRTLTRSVDKTANLAKKHLPDDKRFYKRIELLGESVGVIRYQLDLLDDIYRQEIVPNQPRSTRRTKR